MPLLVNINRAQLVELLPRDATVAEIGVFRGGFAAHISRRCKPKRLHLIDPWGTTSKDEYVREYRVKDDMEQLYKNVTNMFQMEIKEGRVIIHRQYSYEVAESFPDYYFDWIYIDGMHSYDAVYRDLTTFRNKVKSDGFILGHDFSNTRMGRIKQFGVVQAVTQFCKEFKYSVLAITNEDAPSYILTPNPDATPAKEFLLRLVNVAGISLVEVDTALLMTFDQQEFTYASGKRKQLFRFHANPEQS